MSLHQVAGHKYDGGSCEQFNETRSVARKANKQTMNAWLQVKANEEKR